MERFTQRRRVAVVHDPLAPQLHENVRRLAGLWWLFLALGVVAVAVGGLLVVDVFTAVRTLALLAGLSLLVTGLLDLFSVDRFFPRWLGFLSGALFTTAGILAIAWPGVTLRVIAVLTGAGMLVGGAVHAFGAAAERTNPRWWLVRAAGLLSVVAGVLALIWPDVTILVLAVLLGVRTLVLGVVEIAFGLSLRSLVDALPSSKVNNTGEARG